MSVPFPIGKLGVAPAGCMSDVTEMECGRSEIEELIKEVRGGVSGIFQEDPQRLREPWALLPEEMERGTPQLPP